MENRIGLEACVETIQECLLAQKFNADRIELCGDLNEGGITPSFGLVKLAKKLLNIPVFVIIRPRAGNFVYDQNEIEIMKNDIEMFKTLNVDGFVFGILNNENEIDLEKNLELIKFICDDFKSFQITFHMAFDNIKEENKLKSIDLLIELGFTRILTKGCSTCALDGLENIKNYNLYSYNRIIIMPGGGVTKDNFKYITEYTKSFEAHGTKIVGLLKN